MSEEATQIEEEIPEEELETSTGVSRNEAAREALYAAREAEEDSEPSFEEPEPEELEVEEEEVTQIEMMSFEDDDGNEYQVPKAAKLKLKIDGEEEERTLDATIRNYQKGAAGDKKLQEASQQLRLIEEKSGELTMREQAFQQTVGQASQQHADGDLSNDDYEDAIGQAVTALVDADEDTAREVLSKVLKRPEPVQQTVSLSDEALDSALRKREEKLAVRWFDKEYKDLATNPVYRNMVDVKTVEIMTEDPDMFPKDVLREAAKAVEEAIEEEKNNDLRGRLGEAGISKTEIENIISGKKAKPKTQKKSVPTPTGGRVPSDQGEKEETRADVMQEYRRQRHQPT